MEPIEPQPPIRVYTTDDGLVILDQQDPDRSEPDVITMLPGDVDRLIDQLKAAKQRAAQQ